MHAFAAASTARIAAIAIRFPGRGLSSSVARPRIVRGLASCALACGLAFGAANARADVISADTASNPPGISQSESARHSLAQPQIRWLLARFITQARSVPADAHVLSRDFLDAYHYAVGDAAVALNAYARDERPYERMLAHERNEVDVSSIASDGEGRFEIAWTETRYAGDALAVVEYWHALLEAGAANEAVAVGNPFDFYVRDIVWSRYD
jgi:type IV secretory pathway TrbF-like protein